MIQDASCGAITNNTTASVMDETIKPQATNLIVNELLPGDDGKFPPDIETT